MRGIGGGSESVRTVTNGILDTEGVVELVSPLPNQRTRSRVTTDFGEELHRANSFARDIILS